MSLRVRIPIILLVVLSGVAIVAMIPSEGSAIPAFARKYQMSCTTCHAPFPYLKEYGDEFAGNGFVLADKDAPRYYVETGDQNLSLVRELPLAIRLDGFIKYQSETDRDVDLSTPYNIKLLSGGSLTDNVAYYLYFFFSERGEVAGLEDAFVMFNNVFDTELDLYIGQFQISDPLFKRELRLTYEDYQIYRTSVGESSLDLRYDRGIMMTYGFESGTDIVFEVVNGSGLREADEYRVYDNDTYKNFVGYVSQGIGDYVSVGMFGFWGKEKSGVTNEVWYLGPNVSAGNDRVTVNLQYLERRDDNPLFAATAPDDKVATKGGLAEVIYTPGGDQTKWYAVGSYNKVDSDINEDDYETITGHIGYVFRTNMRMIVENTYDIEHEENRFLIGIITGF